MTRRVRLSIPIVAVATLAIGIGAATAVVTVAEALLVRPMPVDRESELVVLWGASPDGQFPNVPVTLPEVEELRRSSRALRGIGFYGFRGASTATFGDADRAVQLRVAMVSGNWFEVLGTRPALGQFFRPDDDVRGALPTLVLSHRAWQQAFGGDSSVSGRSVTLATTGRSYRIVGVMPPGAEYPRGVDAWTPLLAWSSELGSYELASNELDLLGRLAAGATPSQAADEVSAILSRVEPPSLRAGATAVVHGLRESFLGDTATAMRLVLLAAATLLLVACLNVANLLLLQSVDQASDLVVRAALGAPRSRLVREQLARCARVALAAGLAGSVLALMLLKFFLLYAPPSLPRLEAIVPDAAALASAIGITLVCLVGAGLAPAILASHVDAGSILRAGRRHAASRPVRLAGEVLVATQVGLAVVTLSAAALVARSLVNLQRTDLHFDPSRLVVAELAFPRDRFGDPLQARDLLRRITERLTSAPGIRDVAPVLSVPFVGGGGGIDGRIGLPGQSPLEVARNPLVNMDVVTPAYFTTVGTPLLAGRAFGEADREGAPRVAIVSRRVADALWPGEDPIGRRVALQGEVTVVGVVPDTRYRDLRTERPTVYFPLAQSVFPVSPTRLIVRADIVGDVPPRIRQALADVDGAVTLARVGTVQEHLDLAWEQPRLNSLILVVFAAAALCLAGAGLFAVMSAMVRRRSRELAIRMALGATQGAVTRLVLARGTAIAGAGALAGMLAARATAVLLAGLLYGIEATDASTMRWVVSLVLAIAIMASLAPARYGAGTDPAQVLRADG